MVDATNFTRLYGLFVATGKSHEEARDLAETTEGCVLSVRIFGPPRTGKTALSERIRDALTKAGMVCAGGVDPRGDEIRVLVPPRADD